MRQERASDFKKGTVYLGRNYGMIHFTVEINFIDY